MRECFVAEAGQPSGERRLRRKGARRQRREVWLQVTCMLSTKSRSSQSRLIARPVTEAAMLPCLKILLTFLDAPSRSGNVRWSEMQTGAVFHILSIACQEFRHTAVWKHCRPTAP